MNPDDVDQVECLCEPHYNEPDQVICVKLRSVSKLLDKANGALDNSDMQFKYPVYQNKDNTLAFQGLDFGITEGSRITNSNQTWVFAAQIGEGTQSEDGILSYGDKPQQGTFELSAGDAAFTGNLRVTKRGVGGVGFVTGVENTSFKLWGKGGENHGEALIWYENGIKKWMWYFYEDIQQNGQQSPNPAFYIGDEFGNRNVDDDGNYLGGWTLPYGEFTDSGIDMYIHFTSTNYFVRSSQFNGRVDTGIGANSNFNVYSLEFDRELYLLNFYVNGVNTITQAFFKLPLGEKQRISIFSDLTASLRADGKFGELLILPYIDQVTRKGIESYLGNKWNIAVASPSIVASDFEGPAEPTGRSEVINKYPPVLEDKPEGLSVFIKDEGVVAETPSGGIWLGSGDVSMIAPPEQGGTLTLTDTQGLFMSSDRGTFIGWCAHQGSDYIIMRLYVQYYTKIYNSDGTIQNVSKKVYNGIFDPRKPNVLSRALEQCRNIFSYGLPDHRRFYPISWASDPSDPARITHKVSGFGDYRDGFYAKVLETDKIGTKLGAYVYLKHNQYSYANSQYPTYRTYEGEYSDIFRYYIESSGSSTLFEDDLVEDGKVFYDYEKVANLDCSLPSLGEEAYIYAVLDGVDDNIPQMQSTITISQKLGSRNHGGYHVAKSNDMDSLSDEDGVFSFGVSYLVEEVSQVCSATSPIVPLITIKDEVENFTYNTSIVNGDVILAEVNGDHFRKSYNGNICIISAKYQAGEEPLSLDRDGLRGFYHVRNDLVDYHRRGEEGYLFEGEIRRLIREPNVPDFVRAGHQVEDPLDVDCFIISDDVSNVKVELDYDYEIHDTITGTPSWADYWGWLTLSNDGLRMVTSYGVVYKRDGLSSNDAWYEIATVGGNYEADITLGRQSSSGAKISGNGQYIARSGGTQVDVFRINNDDTVSKIQEIESPHPTNLNFTEYFGKTIDISKDGNYIAIGSWYTSGVEGTSSFEGIFYIYKKQPNGQFVKADTTPTKLRGQDFGLRSGFGGDGSMRFGCDFSPNGKTLIFSCNSIASETYRTPVMVLDESTDTWNFSFETLSSVYRYGGYVELQDVYGAVHEGTGNTLSHFAYTSQKTYKQTKISPTSNFYLSHANLQSDGRVALQSGYNRMSWDSQTGLYNGYYPRPVEINVWRTDPNMKEARTIKNNYYYNPNNFNRVTQTGNYTFKGPMTLAALKLQIGSISELYIFAEGKLNVMRLDQNTL
jgi:hypothetical protein